ncbi:hypothetical protein COCSADRAFT_91355, partial [Bipolaris sorokiniana ND90Pr]
LLIINGYKSHYSIRSYNHYKKKNIILIYIPLYLSYLLQPLNVTYFSPLKRKYSNIFLGLARNRTNYISKETFLLAFKTTFKQSII